MQVRNIKSIQVFNAVCAASNVTRAAQELSISQSSVSYHIKKLETDLGTVLFHRTPTGLELTEDGTMLAKHVEDGLGTIKMGIDRIRTRAEEVKVALLPMFASRWLSPRLGDLLQAAPDLTLSILNHNNGYARLANPESFADLGIQWGRGNWDKFHVTRLWAEKLVVVCSPNYLKEYRIETPEDLLSCTLLHVDDTRMWAEWFGDNGLEFCDSVAQMMLEDRHFQLSSTINGLGVSLFASWLVTGELESGELINPFGCVFDTSFAYHLVVPKGAEVRRPIRRFSDWLVELSRSENRLQ